LKKFRKLIKILRSYHQISQYILRRCIYAYKGPKIKLSSNINWWQKRAAILFYWRRSWKEVCEAGI